MYDMKPLIQKFRDNRKRLGISQTEFARRIGTSLATITRWERGNMVYTPDLRQLSLIADLFDTTVRELLTPDAPETVTNDEMPQAVEALPAASSDDLPAESASSEIPAVVNIDEEQGLPSGLQEDTPPTDQPVPELITHDEASEVSQSIMNDESASVPSADSEEAQESPIPAAHDETPQDADTPLLGTDDELPQAEAAPEVQEIASIDEQESGSPDISAIVTPDETTPDVEMNSTKVLESVIDDEAASEAQDSISNEETQEEPSTPQAVSTDEPQIQDSSSQELFSIVASDESPTAAETIAAEATETDISSEEQPEGSIVSPDDRSKSVMIDENPSEESTMPKKTTAALPEEAPEELTAATIITSDDHTESVISDEEAQPERSSVMNDEIPIGKSPMPEAPSIVNNDEPAEDQPLPSIATTDKTIEPAPVVEAIEAEQAEQTEPQGEDNAAPGPFQIITPDEPRQENDAPILSAGDELPQETPASRASSTVSHDDVQETAADTPGEAPQEQASVAANTPSKPWEALGMSKAWYYRLRQQGRLEEYLKGKTKN